MNRKVSNCCKASIRQELAGLDDFDGYTYICNECSKPCTLYTPEAKEQGKEMMIERFTDNPNNRTVPLSTIPLSPTPQIKEK